jgi:putative membrane protein
MSKREIILLIAGYFSVLLWSFIGAYDHFTWFLEVVPTFIGLPLLFLTYKSHPLSRYLYWILLVHAIVLMIGGHYTYARVPLFEDLKPIMGWTRNNYDKVGHFFQGFVPALIAQDILVRKVGIKQRGWVLFLAICVALAFSATYELFEWQMAIWTGSKSDDFLGSQGDVWDTQKDMMWALIGSCISGIYLGLHK